MINRMCSVYFHGGVFVCVGYQRDSNWVYRASGPVIAVSEGEPAPVLDKAIHKCLAGARSLFNFSSVTARVVAALGFDSWNEVCKHAYCWHIDEEVDLIHVVAQKRGGDSFVPNNDVAFEIATGEIARGESVADRLHAMLP